MKNTICSLLFILTSLLLIQPSIATATDKVRYVGSSSLTVVSPSARFTAHVQYSGFDLDQLIVKKYSGKRKGYLQQLSYPIDSISICSVTDDGITTYIDYDRKQVMTINESGSIINTTVGTLCPEQDDSQQSSKITDSIQLRQVLCTLPATTRVETPEGRARIYDIFSIQKLPGKQVLATVTTTPLDADSLKFGNFDASPMLVLIDQSRSTTNYCVQSSIISTSDSTDCRMEVSPTNAGSFLTTFSKPFMYTNDSGPKNCTFQISLNKPKQLSNEHLEALVEWQVGEYSPSEIVSRKSVKKADKTVDISIDINRRCGHVIKLIPSNRRLRTNAFGLGDLYCSHV